MTALHTIAAEFLEAVESDAGVWSERMNGLQLSLQQKAIACGLWLLARSAEQDVLRAEIARLQARESALQAELQRTREYVARCLVQAGVTRVRDPRLTLWVQAAPPRVEVADVTLVPAEYLRPPAPVVPQPDKARIREALQAGEDVPGARLVQGAPTLRVR